MPELPEVEVVRAGLAPAVTGARIIGCEVLDPRALKRHVPLTGGFSDGRSGHGVTLTAAEGALRAADFERRVVGLTLAAPVRRGKFMWIPVAAGVAVDGGDGDAGLALLAHLGMSGQMLLRDLDAGDDRHVRIRLWLEHPTHGELRLDFADQRLFGSLALDDLVPDLFAATSEPLVPSLPLVPGQAVHIAPDPLEPTFDDAAFVSRLRARSRGVKQLILDQSLVSGVGNIYADEALWRARLHPETAGSSVSVRKARELLVALRDVFEKALAEGGTSFDEQYVNVNGQAGHFQRELHVYGLEGNPCSRCGNAITRKKFMNRSSHFCLVCQQKR
ncbi:bifunctional DNA-formamidopyrimidine glycosylase/DNA-(apurinic or apyrimidinic site) lyase [Leucobacter salsicius]|uniref:bifunctional DNA-formamidopyrimidine glycosylase/DNA-(apurinic or apyrimidinic site) lyase n=1 Tax=Leucobacter salsicius TaxID=664638 RepID=UPI00034D0FCC|nr:bifunctional DNA-formamidopyrimidine glycosylase/DNA-(apurinic or apyrimidinic site) lyase [Leucobacter salsicius]